MPEKGKLYSSYYNEYLGGVKDNFANPNKIAVVMSAPHKEQELDQVVEEMVRQNHMEDWSLENIYNELHNPPAGKLFKMSESLQKAEQSLGINLEQSKNLEQDNLIIHTNSRKSERIHEENPNSIQAGSI